MYDKRKKENSGFTLVELLVSVTILAIIVTPLLHTFVSAARTNAKSHAALRATTIAENIMEEFEDASMEELENKYLVAQNPDGTYLFSFPAAQLSEIGSDHFTAQVSLNPNNGYQTYNEKSVVDVDAISAINNAIYSMGTTYDESVYDDFESKSESASIMDSSYHKKDAAWFRTALHRTISVEMKRGAMITASDGITTFPAVKVIAEIKYEYRSNHIEKVLLDADLSYSVKKDLFDNTTTKEPLNGVYLIYSPRFEACDGAAGKKDEVIVKNEGNVIANLFLIRLERGDDATYLNHYLSGKKAKLTVIEKPTWTGGFTEATPGALELRTNLHTAPVAGVVQPGLEVNYTNHIQEAHTPVAEKILNIKTADGRFFDGKAVKQRIYKMKVSVFKEGETDPLVELEGTKMD